MNFLIAGVQKGGTSSLDAYLRQHPMIRMANVKEIHFFDEDKYFPGGVADYGLLARQFEPAGPGVLYGEATPIYTYWADAMRRIYDYNKDMKLIALLRNPAERAWSHWRMETGRNADSLPFSDAIRGERQRLREALPLQHRVYSYVDRGFYSEQIRRIWRYFDDSNVLFIKSERFFTSAAAVVDEVVRFLGLPPAPIDTAEIHNPGVLEAPIAAEDRAYLVEQFRPDVALVEQLLGWDCADWLA